MKWLALAVCLLVARPADAQTFSYERRDCGVPIITAWMTAPNSQRYAMSFVLKNMAGIDGQVQAFVRQWLVPKFNDRTAPSNDSQGYSLHANRLGWIVLGQSPLGEGCD